MHGRRYLGVDLSAEYCAIAEDRLASTSVANIIDGLVQE
jgi:DNA modification methylase